jgi:hypothetical protein
MDALVARAREVAPPGVTLWVADGNAAAAALYDGLGLGRTGRTGAFPPPREHITEHERRLVLSTQDPVRGVRRTAR